MGPPSSAKPTPLRNSYWVLPGKVLAGEHPGGTNRDATRERLQRLMDAGVECFIDLTEPGELKPYDPELPFSIEYLRKPIKDHGIPSQRGHMAEILDCVHDALQSGRGVYIHCRAGIGRTGTVVGCFLVERGLLGESALDELNRLWQQNERSQNWPSVPETPDQIKYIVNWKPRGIFDDQGALTTPTILSSGPALDDDPEDLSSPGGGDAPWAHLMSDAAPSAGPRPASGAAAPPPRAPGAVRPLRTGSGASRETPAARPGTDASRANAVPPSNSGAIAIPTNAGAWGDAPGAPGSGPNTPPDNAGASGPSSSAPSATGFGSSRAAMANAARAAASEDQSGAGGILSDPTAVAKLPQPTARRPLRPGSVATSAPRDPAAASAQGGPAAPNARPSASSGRRPDAPTAAGAARPGTTAAAGEGRRPADPLATEPSWIASNGRAGEPPTPAATPKSAAGQPPSPRARVSAAQPKVGAPTEAAAAPSLAGFDRFQSTAEDDESDPLLSPEALTAVSQFRDRFIGALIGLAIGDAVAAATQYRRPGSFTPVGDMLGGGPFDLPRGGWSDDTSMALCLADSLLERNSFDARDQVERYRRWQTEGYLSATGQCVGITASSARAIAMAQWRRQAFFGSHDPSQQDPEPLSRVTPAVLFYFATSGEAINQATEAARTTCQAPAVLDACRALASALHAAVSGQPKAVVLAKATLAVTDAATTPGATGPNAGGPATGPGGIPPPRVGSSAPAALAAAVQAFGATDNFRDAILYAANLGGDSDVVAAACGQLAGAYYTVKAIPTSWLNGLMQKELILGYADRLLAHAMVGLSG